MDSLKEIDSRGVLRTLTPAVEFPEIKLFRQKNSPFELRKQFGVAKSAAVVSIFGSVEEDNQQKVFVEAAVSVLRNHPEADIHFFIVGLRSNDYSESIKNFVENSNQSTRFHLIPESANPAERYPLFWITDICVTCRNEDVFPLTILEAMAFKKAVIATNNAAASRVVEDWGNGFLIPPNDSIELANRLSELIQKMDLTEDFGRRGHEIAMDHYHIKKSGSNLERFLRESIVY
jgi:glycosyltransferase involved in cell wall biosynthesis